jgi:hypothetical protein
MSSSEINQLSAAELRRRRQAREAIDRKTKDLFDKLVVDTHNTAARLAADKAAADTAAAEALAAAVQVYGSTEEVTELTGIPASEVEGAVKAVTVARVKEVVEQVRADAIAKNSAATRRRREPRGDQPDLQAHPIDSNHTEPNHAPAPTEDESTPGTAPTQEAS